MPLRQTGYGNNIFFWKQEQDLAAYMIYRSAENDADKRNADDISPIEIANAAKQILKDQISLTKEDLIRETARLFSFSKVGSIVDTAMRQGIQLAVANGYTKEQNGRIVCA